VPAHSEVLAFDMDGVLIDSRESIIYSLNSVLVPLGYSNVDVLRSDLIGLAIVPMLNMLTDNQLDARELAACVSRYRSINDEIGPKKSSIYKDIPRVLNELSTRYQLVVVTSKLQISAQLLLRSFDLDKYFVGIFGPEKDGEYEPKHRTLERSRNLVFRNLKVSTEIFALVGDRDTDIEAAHRFGILGFGALWGYGASGELDGADISFNAPSDLLRIMNRNH
jgi:phosphoglycolate phosphatase